MAGRAERRPGALSSLRAVALGIGFGCALVASVTIFLTDDARLLRIGILVALWGFVLAALAAGRRQTEQAMIASTEIELRKGYELELQQEVAARREYELRLEAQLRRELQEDFAHQVGDLQDEMGRLRRELSEQWDSELRVERMVMRTQSVRMGTDRRESLENGAASLSGSLGIEAPTDNHQPRSNEPASYQSSAYQSSGYQPSGYESGGSESGGYESGGYESAGSGSAGYESAGDAAFDRDHGPSTREVPVVPPTAGFAPAPPLPPMSPASSLGGSPAGSPTASAPPPGRDEDDVLTRVLAEAGASVSGRRRKHRYADEDEDLAAPY